MRDSKLHACRSAAAKVTQRTEPCSQAFFPSWNVSGKFFDARMPESAADHGRIQNFLFWEPNLGALLSEANNFHP